MSNRQLQAENEQQAAKIKELEAALQAKTDELAKAQAAPVAAVSKGRQQAQKAKELLEANASVTLVQLAEINSKYPSDPIYYARTILGLNVKTSKVKGGKTTYSLVKETPAAPAPAPSAEAAQTEATPAPVIEAASEPAATSVEAAA